MSWIDDKANAELGRIRDAKEQQVYPLFRAFESAGLHTRYEGKPIVQFSSNDYLGLTQHPKVKEAAKRAVDKHAMGLSSSRPQATTVAHVELEHRVAVRTHELQRSNRELQSEIMDRKRAEKLQRSLFRITDLAITSETL